MLDEGRDNTILVGVKQTSRAISEGKALKVYIANDAEQHVVRRVIEMSKDADVQVVRVETMKELGRICKIDVGAATAVLIK